MNNRDRVLTIGGWRQTYIRNRYARRECVQRRRAGGLPTVGEQDDLRLESAGPTNDVAGQLQGGTQIGAVGWDGRVRTVEHGVATEVDHARLTAWWQLRAGLRHPGARPRDLIGAEAVRNIHREDH